MVDNHVKMPDVVPVVRYTASGVQTVYAYPFPIFASEDIAVYLDGALQSSGYSVTGEGVTSGGDVTFTTAPIQDVIVTIERRVPLERLTDFLEGGDLSARSLNNELDYLTASIQQIARDQTGMLRYDGLEQPGAVVLPDVAARANRALAFDEHGGLTTVPHGVTQAAPSYVQAGTGAVSRTVTDRAQDVISVRDFGAVGDGLTDDTVAIQNALAAHTAVYIPRGMYLISATLVVDEGQSLYGDGASSIIKANSSIFNVVEIRAGHACVRGLKIQNGAIGIKLYGVNGPCVQNTISDVMIDAVETGVQLDGYNDTNKPCYWNNFINVLVKKPTVNGVHLMLSDIGDTPNANRFTKLRVYSNGTEISGSGVYLEDGGNANSFTDCEVNVDGTADACVRVGANVDKTFFNGLYTESTNLVPNVQLDSGSSDTSIINLHAQSDGAAIDDHSGGAYTAYNAGYPNNNTLSKTSVSDLTTTLQRYDTVYVDAPGAATIDVTTERTVHLVAATNGAITLRLPAASDAVAAVYTIKKVDFTGNIVTVTAISGNGPDGKDMFLGGPYDYVTVQSNGAAWYILSSNRMSGNTTYFDGSGTYDIDMATDTYLLSSFGGALTSRLPPANATGAIGRTVTIKKTDVSGHAVTITVQGGGNIDGSSSLSLSSQYHAATLVSNGAQWFIISKHP